MLTYIEANLHPERVPYADLCAALKLWHEPRPDASGSIRIALTCLGTPKTGTWWHSGVISGTRAMRFSIRRTTLREWRRVLERRTSWDSPDALGEHLRARLAGEPTVLVLGLHAADQS